MEILKETIKQTGTLFTLSDVTKLLRENSDIKEMEYKYLYFFRRSDGYMYDLVNNYVGDFLAYYTPLFKFKEFVISHHAYRIYQMADDYFEEIDKYVDFLKNIRAVIGGIKFKSVKHLLTVLRDADIEAQVYDLSYPTAYWCPQHFTERKTLSLNKSGLTMHIPIYYARNVHGNALQETLDHILQNIE